MPDCLLASLTNFRRSILCATIGLVQIGLAETSPAHAASFTTAVSKDGQTIVLLDGRIEPGDGMRLALVVSALGNQGRAVSALYLNSPGGNADGDMAALVKRLKISTIVADGAKCASACFTVFAAGHRKLAGFGARIGVHRASEKGDETAAAFAETVEMARIVSKLGVPPAIVGKLMLTPPDQIAWLTPGDLKSMDVTVTGMLRWPGPIEPVARHSASEDARERAGATPRRLTPLKPEGMDWSEYVAEAEGLSRRAFGPGDLREACNLYTMRCSRSFVFIDADEIRTRVTTVEDLSGNIVQREVCKDDVGGGVHSCLDWDTLEKYHAERDRDGQWKRKRVSSGRD